MSGRRLVINLTAEAPASFSQRAATEGAHQTLDMPTGASLMGWAASQCYDALGPAAQTVFHSGLVRFSDAVRIVQQQAVFRAPATLLKPKHTDGAACLGRRAYLETHGISMAAEPVKSMWATLSGDLVSKAGRRVRLRTAVDRFRRAAEDNKLFSQEALSARDAHYRAVVECDEGVLEDEDWKRLVGAFDGRISLGRGKRSGYGGQYLCEWLDDAANPFPGPEASGIVEGGIVRMWLLSDAQLSGALGRSVHCPQASDFGLDPEGWVFEPAESSISSRRALTWNGTYQSHDLELPLVEAGSVIAFRRKGAGAQSGQLRPLIGIGHQRGYGRYAVIPPELSFKIEKQTQEQVRETGEEQWESLRAELGLANRVVLDWARAQAGIRGHEDEPDWTEARIGDARSIIDRMNGDHPGKSQWSEVANLIDSWVAEDRAFAEALAKRLQQACWGAWFAGLDTWVAEDLFAIPLAPATRAQRARGIERVIKALRDYRPLDAVISASSDKEVAE